jgi:hypothetical protein
MKNDSLLVSREFLTEVEDLLACPQSHVRAEYIKAYKHLGEILAAPVVERQPLSVWEGSMPESNGKSNFTVILHTGDITEGICVYRSEYPDRARYEADCFRHLIGDPEFPEKPFICDYDADKHSGYIKPDTAPPELAELQATIAQLETKLNNAINLDFERRAEIERLKLDHQHMVGRNALLRQRPDLPVDRIPAHNQLIALQAEIERLKGGQGEPVAWVIQRGSIIEGMTGHRNVQFDRPSNECLRAHGVEPLYTSQPALVSADAAKAFAKGFNTLETIDGKYKIVMQFAGHDDAWAAYTELSQMTACLDKVKEMNATRPSHVDAPADCGTHPHNDGLDDYRGKV